MGKDLGDIVISPYFYMSRKGKKDLSALVIQVVMLGRPMLQQSPEFVFQLESFSSLAATAKSAWSK
jgi:hypothetical protein